MPTNSDNSTVAILLVCMGNICRSPSAEGVLRHQIDSANLPCELIVDSAGTHAYHVREAPDSRAQAAALRRGIDLSGLRARAVEPADFYSFDFILAMDDENLTILEAMRPADSRAQVELFLNFSATMQGQSVPDPYYGGSTGFEHVLDMLEDASRGFLEYLRRRPQAPPQN